MCCLFFKHEWQWNKKVLKNMFCLREPGSHKTIKELLMITNYILSHLSNLQIKIQLFFSHNRKYTNKRKCILGCALWHSVEITSQLLTLLNILIRRVLTSVSYSYEKKAFWISWIFVSQRNVARNTGDIHSRMKVKSALMQISKSLYMFLFI